ncbi:MAG: Hsp20/alpha crystallin family protein [Candidatus Nanohaloarchaeota archaeon QJJ-7]|nr:Hsp20/alpha crystallin family protein [Candidatus Nanohaloarchaeota archaeon QJJ-7]
MDRKDPFEQMRRTMEQVFRSLQDLETELPETRTSVVPVDIKESDGQITVTADLPGLESDRIQVEASEDSVEIHAEHEEEMEEEQKDFYRRERNSRTFHRAVSLPAPVDPETAEAEYENGVLTVDLEKSEKSGKKRVEVE